MHLLVVIDSSGLCHILEICTFGQERRWWWCGAFRGERGAPLLCWNVARTRRLQGTHSSLEVPFQGCFDLSSVQVIRINIRQYWKGTYRQSKTCLRGRRVSSNHITPEICDALGKEYHNFLVEHVYHMVLVWHHTTPVHVTLHDGHADCQE